MNDCSWMPTDEEEKLLRQRRGWKSKKTGEAFEDIIDFVTSLEKI